MRYLSVCSGIEAATCAWRPLGWEPAGFSEVAAFPRAVLKHHYPGVPLAGDFRTIKGDEYGAVDVLVGGTPCQDFSIAGLREGITGKRGALTLEFLRLAQRLHPRWIVWENVPGVLHTNGGRAFGALLGGLALLRYGFAYRILDAQYYGLAQRRARVFVIGYSGGDWRPPASVLFEREGLLRYSAPSRKAAKEARARTAGSPRRGSEEAQGEIAPPLHAGNGQWPGLDVDSVDSLLISPDVANPLTARMAKGVNTTADEGQTMVFNMRQDPLDYGGRTGPLDVDGFSYGIVRGAQVRRLTPRECERLMGLPDDYTLVPWRRGKLATDGLRYTALGNSMAVPVVRWLGERIAYIEALQKEAAA